MIQDQDKNRFPEQTESEKFHGTTDSQDNKEKAKNESTHLTDRSGEEKKEDYINTDERKKDLNQRGL